MCLQHQILSLGTIVDLEMLLMEKLLSGTWRSIFKYFYDTDRPHTHPWEMLGFSEKPAYWEDRYGPAPYTWRQWHIVERLKPWLYSCWYSCWI